jgi:hypothetical protein
LKRLLVLFATLVIACGFVATASAAVSVSQGTVPPPYGSFSFQTYYQPVNPYHCGPGVSLSDSRPILLKFGWFASAPSQVGTFFKQEHGTYTLSGPGGSVTETWGETTDGSPAQGTYVKWSPISADTLTSPGGSTTPGYDSWYFGILSFDTPGTYTLNTAWTIDKNLYDGFGVIKGATYDFSCTLQVSQ